MLIDWFTVGAQVINFVILVWLMKRFLYRPILQAIDAREQRIAAQLDSADAKEAEAREERDEFQRKNQEFDQQLAELSRQAAEQAEAERRQLLEDARQAADALSAKRMEGMRSEAHNLSRVITRRAQQEVFAIARKALADLATTSLEARLCEVFTRRLREMNGEAKAGLAAAFEGTSEPALMRSAFELSAEQQQVIQAALTEAFSSEARLQFEVAPDLISGIELTVNGQKLSWSISDYLASLGRRVDELVGNPAQSQ